MGLRRQAPAGAEALRDPARMAASSAGLAFMLSVIPFLRFDAGYLRKAKEQLAKVQRPALAAQALLKAVEAGTNTSRGQWERARAGLDERRRMQDFRQGFFALANGVLLELWRGDIAAFRDRVSHLESAARRVDSAWGLFWVWCFHGLLTGRAGNFDRTAQVLLEAGKYEARAQDRLVSLWWRGLLALCALRRGDTEDALRQADLALDGVLNAPIMVPATLEGLSSLIEVYSTIVSEATDNPRKTRVHRRLRHSLALLRTFGAAFPICRPGRSSGMAALLCSWATSGLPAGCFGWQSQLPATSACHSTRRWRIKHSPRLPSYAAKRSAQDKSASWRAVYSSALTRCGT